MYRNKEGFKNENFITHIFKQSAQAADVVQCAVGAGSSSCTQSKSMSSSCTRPTSWSSIGPRITSRNTLQHSLVWKSFHFYFQSCQYTSYFELNRVSVTLDQIESFRVKLCQIYQIDLKKTHKFKIKLTKKQQTISYWNKVKFFQESIFFTNQFPCRIYYWVARRMKGKNKYVCMYLEKIGFWVSILFHPPGYSVDAQTRKLVHEKKCLLEKIWLLWKMS